MVSVYDLKPRFQALLRPLCGGLAAAGVTANHVTVTATILSVLYGLWIYASGGSDLSLILLPFFLLVRMAFNAIDGMLAREFGQKSDLGFYLNEVGDVISDTALYLPFAVLLDPLLVGAVIVLSVMTEFAGVLALGLKKERRYDGPFGKSDRAVAFGVLGYLLVFVQMSVHVQNGLLMVMAALCAMTIYNRMRKGLKDV